MSLIALVLMTIAGGLTTETRADNRLYIEPVVGKVGGTVNIPVYLDNSDDIVAAQFDVTLPFNIPSDGVVTMSNRSNGHAVSSSVNGKTITVMLPFFIIQNRTYFASFVLFFFLLLLP